MKRTRLVVVLACLVLVNSCRWAVRVDLRGSHCSNAWATCNADFIMRDAPHSLSKQALQEPFVPLLENEALYDPQLSMVRNHKTNRDGFGVGYFKSHPYKPTMAEVRRSGHPIVEEDGSPSRQLQKALRGVRSTTIFGHIRAGTEGNTGDKRNAHPFRYKKAGHSFLWMHNGGVARWAQMKQLVRDGLSEESLSQIHGDTDSEHVGALFLEKLGEPVTDQSIFPPRQIARALAAVVHELDDADQDAERLEYGEQAAQHGQACHSGSSLNFVVSDGYTTAATRYRSCRGHAPPSLYMNQERLQMGVTFLASEPVDRQTEGWSLVGKDEMVVLTVDGEFWRECLSDACQKTAPSHGEL